MLAAARSMSAYALRRARFPTHVTRYARGSLAPLARRAVASPLCAASEAAAKGPATAAGGDAKAPYPPLKVTAPGRVVALGDVHGDIGQAQRETTLAQFRRGAFTVLVATDVAARGIDVKGVDLVVPRPRGRGSRRDRRRRAGTAGRRGWGGLRRRAEAEVAHDDAADAPGLRGRDGHTRLRRVVTGLALLDLHGVATAVDRDDPTERQARVVGPFLRAGAGAPTRALEARVLVVVAPAHASTNRSQTGAKFG